MAIRLRTVDSVRVALCAAETDVVAGDVYLDDSDHYALAAKFRLDWKTNPDVWPTYPVEWAAMATQKRRDAEAEIIAFCKTQLASFKVPKAVVFGMIPKTSTGKIQKFQLRGQVGSVKAFTG